MAKYTLRKAKKEVSLNKSNFVYQGGEGSVYIIGDRVFKVCDKGHMIPDAKLQELVVLSHPQIIVPDDVLLKGNKAVGYAMPAVTGNPMPLAQILTKTYREREGVTPAMMAELVTQLMDGLRFIHQHDGYLQVDCNELNYMVPDTYDLLSFIDMNSAQTPSFPADAIMLSIRDWTVGQDAQGAWQWSKLSDYYSAAIISFYMFTGMHPFKCYHPSYTDKKTAMIEQMKANASVFDPQAEFPKGAVYHPFEDVIPGGKDGAFMQWYRAEFVEGKRLPPPDSFQATIELVVRLKEIVGSNTFAMELIRDYGNKLTGYYGTPDPGSPVVVTTKHIVTSRGSVAKPADKVRVCFTKQNTPIAVYLDGEDVRLSNLHTSATIRIDLMGSHIMTTDGRAYVQCDDHLFEISFITDTMAVTTPVATIMPHATQLMQGVAIQNMFGAYYASMFPEAGHHQQIKLQELEGYRITDAKYEGHVLMVVGFDKDRAEYDRFVFRFDRHFSDYDVRKIENIQPVGLNFTVNDKGICVCITEEERVEIFASKMGKQDVKSFDDPAIEGDMRLCHSGSQIRFAQGSKLYSFAIKK